MPKPGLIIGLSLLLSGVTRVRIMLEAWNYSAIKD